jgi:glutathione-regulated potassium-efflux system ancillary protein KefG
MKNKILILFAHPRLERSQNNIELLNNIPKIPEITIHDLYEKYSDFNIDLKYEKEVLAGHNIIVWQHPFYWYSAPPLLKQWIDIVLEFGWAYGPGGNALQGKIVFSAITTGGQRHAYSHEGYNRYSIQELLTPFEQTAWLCKMTWLPTYVIHGTHHISRENIKIEGENYRELLLRFVSGDFSASEIKKYTYLNDWMSESANKSLQK